MIKTLKFSNSSFAALGNLQVQPQVNHIAATAKQSVVQAVSHASAVPPAHQAALATPLLLHNASDLKVETKHSLHTITNHLINNPKTILPPYHSRLISHIMPTFALHLEPVDLTRRHASDDLIVTAKKFEPYEQLTGISHERPEVVMLTNFMPLFEKEVSHSQPSFIHLVENGGIYPYMTDAGRFIDTHLQARHLRHVNTIHVLRSLRYRYGWMHDYYYTRKQAFHKNVDALRDSANFLLELVRSLERLKGQLDLRDDIHVVDPHSVVNYHHLHFTKIHALSTANVLYDIIRRYMPLQYTVPDALVRLGYNADNVKHKFSSTKIWMQLLLEMKDLLRFHSAEFLDIDPVAQRRDANAIGITKLNTRHFELRESLPGLPPLAELSKLSPGQLPSAVNVISQAWNVLYKDVHFKNNEARIAALANMVSKEFRYSYGLSANDVKQSLVDQFSYAVSPADNVDVFDAIVGRFGNNITDFPATQTNSLVNISQRQPASNVAVLTFESKYVDGDTGTLTPGGSFYVDQVLRTDGQKFDTSRLDEAGDLFEKTHKNFSVIVNGMNMLATRIYDPYDRTHTQFSSILSSPADFIRDTLRNLIDERTGITLNTAVNDNLGAVYSYAAKNSKIKSALFLYTIAKITRPYHATVPFFHQAVPIIGKGTIDNAPMTDALINSVIQALESTVPQTLTGNQFIVSKLFHVSKSFPTLTKETIKASLKSGTTMSRFVENAMLQILNAFRYGNRAIVDSRTRYNGWLDTTTMMVAFDAIIQMIANYNNQTIASSNHGHTNYNRGILTFNISRTNVNFRASYNNLITKVEKEVALGQKLIYTVFNTLQQLQGAFKNYSNYLKSPTALNKLHQIAAVINDPNLLQMLMSEQQIMLLASTVHDLVSRVSQTGTLPDNADVDGDGDFDADDEIKILDDSVVLPKLRNAVYGLFGTREYAQQKGYNKKIITVGIPLGFTHRLKQRVNIRNLKKTTFVDKQNDIVNVTIYKVDLENSDIIYKPKKFLFELSRFPVRNDAYFNNIPDKPALSDIVRAIPTRDFGQSQTRASEVTYWGITSSDIAMGRKPAFDDESYSFLTNAEKSQIIQNHVVSYLTEVYVRLLTGISLADYHFDLVEPPRPHDDDFVKLITEHHVAHLADSFRVQQTSAAEHHGPSGGVLFSTTASKKIGYTSHTAAAHKASQQPRLGNPAGIAGSISHATQFGSIPTPTVVKTLDAQRAIGTLDANLSSISHRNVSIALHGLRTISNMAHMITPVADPLAVSKRILNPKQFDRVFNVVVDPDDFEIDYDKTVATPHGKHALEQMIRKGDIIPETENYFFRNQVISAAIRDIHSPIARPFVQGRAAPNHALFRFRDRDKTQGDLTFDKYFVTIETYGEDEV